MTDKTITLLGDMEELARDMVWSVESMHDTHAEAVYEYERLSEEDDFLTGPDDDAKFLTEDMDAGVDAADQHTKDFREQLATFDAELMKLILLRGQLAEQIDIPLGGAKWVRLETYEM